MRKIMLSLAGALLCVPAFGTAVYTASSSSTNVEADFTFGNGTLTLVLKNLIVDQTSDGQNISSLSFTLSENFANNIITDTSFSATDRSAIQKNVANGWTDAPDTTSHWLLSNTTNTFNMTTLGFPMAPKTIIGAPNASNTYTNVNASITNQVHDPFYAVTATWILSIPGVTAADEGNLSNVIFGFGTSAGVTETGSCDSCGGGGTTQTVTPEPVSFLLAGSGLALLGLIRFRRKA